MAPLDLTQTSATTFSGTVSAVGTYTLKGTITGVYTGR